MPFTPVRRPARNYVEDIVRAAHSLAAIGLTVGLLLSVIGPAQAAPLTGTVGDFSFSVDDANVPAGATVIGYTGGASATIPDSVSINSTTYVVTAVGDDAFADNTSLASVVIPGTVTTIGTRAFYRNTALASATLTAGLTSIGPNAFAFSASLESIVIPDTVTNIGDYAFYADTSLASVTLPAALTSISPSTFASTTSLASIVIPDTVTFIGAYAFASATSLASLTLPAALTAIGPYAFYATSLTQVVIPAGTTTIGDLAFEASPLVSAMFLGAPPTDVGTAPLGSSPVVVGYYVRFGAVQEPGGFTSPTWNGYTTQAIAIIEYVTIGDPLTPTEVPVGNLIPVPTPPTANGRIFDAWYTEQTGGVAWDFAADTVLADTTLYARFTDAVIVPEPPAPGTPAPGTPAPAATGSTVPGPSTIALADSGPDDPAAPMQGAVVLVLIGGLLVALGRQRRSIEPPLGA